MSDVEESACPPPHLWKKRRMTWVDKATGLGACFAIGGTLYAAGAYVFDLLPFAKASDVAAVAARVTIVEHGFNSINVGQKETQELQLVDRIQSLDDRLLKLKPDTMDYVDFRQQRNESQQRLDRVRQELSAARGR